MDVFVSKENNFLCMITGLLFSVFCNGENFVVATDEWNGVIRRDGGGYYSDLLSEIYPESEFSPQINFMPLKRVYNKVLSGEVDMAFGALRSDVPLRYYPDCPVHISSPDIAVTPELAKNWKGIMSLSNKSVAARIGGNYASYLPADVNYKEYSSLKAMMKMLAAGRVDAVLDYETDMRRFYLGDSDLQYYVVLKNKLTLPIWWLFSDTIKGSRLLAIYNEKMPALIVSGRVKDIMMKYSAHGLEYLSFGLGDCR